MYVRLMINFLCDAGSFLLFTASEVMRIWAYLGGGRELASIIERGRGVNNVVKIKRHIKLKMIDNMDDHSNFITFNILINFPFLF